MGAEGKLEALRSASASSCTSKSLTGESERGTAVVRLRCNRQHQCRKLINQWEKVLTVGSLHLEQIIKNDVHSSNFTCITVHIYVVFQALAMLNSASALLL